MNHTIVSMVATRPARVQCNTCNGVHNYRKEKAATTVAKAATPKGSARLPRKDAGETARKEWTALQLGQNGSRAVPYDMKASYEVGSLISHPKFGVGVVKQLLGPNKIEILFEDGLKLLRCG